jgi:hypothetical protein
MSGHLAKRVSFWIDDANFVREYKRIGGFWLSYRDESFANFRTHGTRVLRVDHSQYVINSVSATATGTPRPTEAKTSCGPLTESWFFNSNRIAVSDCA